MILRTLRSLFLLVARGRELVRYLEDKEGEKIEFRHDKKAPGTTKRRGMAKDDAEYS